MANLDTAAIIAQARSVLEEGAGDLRVIAAGTFAGKSNESLSDTEMSLRAAIKPRYRIVVSPEGYAASHPAQVSDLAIYDVAVTITVIRNVPPVANDDDAVFDAIAAAAGNDADRVAQAMTYPGNMNAGGIVSGQLQYRGSGRVRVQYPQGGGAQQSGLIETEHRFGCKVVVNPVI